MIYSDKYSIIGAKWQNDFRFFVPLSKIIQVYVKLSYVFDYGFSRWIRGGVFEDCTKVRKTARF